MPIESLHRCDTLLKRVLPTLFVLYDVCYLLYYIVYSHTLFSQYTALEDFVSKDEM